MQIGSTEIIDTFAEAFGMRYTRLQLTASDDHWLQAALRELCGYSSSVIACDAEVGIEKQLTTEETYDGRPGANVLAFGFSSEALEKAISTRVGQCVMTCPTTAVYDGLPNTPDRLAMGKKLRYFGDGFQKSKQIDGVRYWRVPVMDGEFLVVDTLGTSKGVAGGNIIIQGESSATALAAARRGVEALRERAGVITPFPGGVARSGSKVGSRYPKLPASTSEAYCPSLRGKVESQLHAGVECAYEIVIDGIDESAVAGAMAAATRAAAGEGIVAITAGNYGGKLGKYHLRLHEILG